MKQKDEESERDDQEPTKEMTKCDAEKKKKRKRRLRTERLEKEVHGVLMALMCESGSDSVRVAAAKAILERINKEQEDDDDDEQEKQRERDEYLAEARGLLAALAALKSSRRSGKIAVA